jgi:hypothetical protein
VNMPERTLRISPVTGIRVDPTLTSIMLAEVMAPSDELWLVSPWISDITTLDNSCGDFDALIADPSARIYPLSEVLALIVSAGAHLTVVTRPDDHNTHFLGRLRDRATSQRLTVITHPDVHEKTLCGRSWLLTGSMNFTVRGMQVNDEAVTYSVNEASAARARMDLTHRWRRPQ